MTTQTKRVAKPRSAVAEATSPTPPKSRTKRRPRLPPSLDRNSAIAAGLQSLSSEGVAAVRVEVLAKRLNVTKGSFYWHFADRPELLQAMLDEWRRSTLTAVVE